MATEQGMPVELYIYDLTHGLASVLSSSIIGEEALFIKDSAEGDGRQLDGVWHTSIVVFGREYFYGGSGVICCSPGGTQLGQPHKIEQLGTTFVPFQVFRDYIEGLATSTYTGAEYRLLEHNCNHFSEEVAQFVCGAHVPKHILAQPDALPPPLRAALRALLDNLAPSADQALVAGGVRQSRARPDSPDFVTLNDQIEEARCACGAGAGGCSGRSNSCRGPGVDVASGDDTATARGAREKLLAWMARAALLLVSPAPLSLLNARLERHAAASDATRAGRCALALATLGRAAQLLRALRERTPAPAGSVPPH